MTSRTHNGTLRPVTAAAVNWDARLCTPADTEDLYSTKTGTQTRIVRTKCRPCPVRSVCLSTALVDEGPGGDVWGIRGGLTDVQRRALRAEQALGNDVDVEQARMLLSAQWRRLVWPMRLRGLSPRQIADRLVGHGLMVSPATVRVAVWWQDGKTSMLPRRGAGDKRADWELVRDECREVVGELRKQAVLVADIAAYLGVTRAALNQALRTWNAEERAATGSQEAVLAA